MKFASTILSLLFLVTLSTALPSPQARLRRDGDSTSPSPQTRTMHGSGGNRSGAGSGATATSAEASVTPAADSARSRSAKVNTHGRTRSATSEDASSTSQSESSSRSGAPDSTAHSGAPEATSTSVSSTSSGTPESSSTAGAPKPSSTSGSNSGSGAEADAVGAVYFTTNDPSGNNIIVSSISTNGNVTFTRAVSTGGHGEHGNDGASPGPDATFSNDLLVVHDGKRLLAAANTGDSTVSLFEIDENDPTKLTMRGAPVDSQGDYPSSLTFNSAGDKLCVMNAGARATILCYNVASEGLQPQSSTLRNIPGYNQTEADPVGPSGTASAIAFTEDESILVVAVKGHAPPNSTPGFLAAWPVESDGGLAQNPTTIMNTGGQGLSFSLTPVPGKNAFVAADFDSTVDVFDLSGDLKDASANPATTSTSIPGNFVLCWSTYSKTVDRYYLASPVSQLLVEVELDDKLKPSIIGTHPVLNGGANIDLVAATANGKDFIFNLVGSTLDIAVLSIDGPGQTSLIGATNFGNVPDVTITSNFVQGLAVYIKS
ncbi:unnamed protein product [Peniophora sp. CBMAI 1063]|nr:unnamed protein product [Peniophora sp. CBMAI 1063]